MLAVLLSTFVLGAADPALTSSALTSSAPTSPAPTAPAASAPPAEPAKSAKAAEMLCHNEKPTGSHMVERVCVSRDDAYKAQQAAEGAMVSINRRTKASANPPK